MENINEIDAQIKQLQSKKTKLQEAEFKEASKHWFTLMNAKYESSSMRTPQYLTFCRVFKRQFKKLLNENFDIVKLEISKPNHFDQHGYFELSNTNIYYFSIGDLRWNNTFLIRTAKSFEDYTGGNNQYVSTEDFEGFMRDLKSIVETEIDNNLHNFTHKKCDTGLFMATKIEAKNAKCSKCDKSFLEGDMD